MNKNALALAAILLPLAMTAYAAKKVDKIDPEPPAGNTSPRPSGMTAKQELGCQIALCMANPAGPTAVSECVPPIRERAELIAKGKPIPSCPGYNDGSTAGNGGGTGGGDTNPRQQQSQQ